jgi:hypothetical protein
MYPVSFGSTCFQHDGEPSEHGDGNFWSNNKPILIKTILYYGVGSKLNVIAIVFEYAPVENCQRYRF